MVLAGVRGWEKQVYRNSYSSSLLTLSWTFCATISALYPYSVAHKGTLDRARQSLLLPEAARVTLVESLVSCSICRGWLNNLQNQFHL